MNKIIKSKLMTVKQFRETPIEDQIQYYEVNLDG